MLNDNYNKELLTFRSYDLLLKTEGARILFILMNQDLIKIHIVHMLGQSEVRKVMVTDQDHVKQGLI